MKFGAYLPSRKFWFNLVIFVSIATFFTCIWALCNRPITVPEWPKQISGFSYSPFRLEHNPQANSYPNEAQIREDLALLSKHTNNVRTYSVEGRLAEIPRLAEEFGLRVTLGIWISSDKERNEREITRGIEVANSSSNVVRVIVGNETLFRQEVTPKQLLAFIQRVRTAVKVPVTTSEQWQIWKQYPEMSNHVDLIAAHILPYWEYVQMDVSTQFVLDRARDLQKLFPQKPLLLSEVGWPSRNGHIRGNTYTSQANQAVYLRTLTNALNAHGYNYFIIEAFDQPWKITNEGAEGAYWGVYNAQRQQKFPFQGPVVEIPQWRVIAIGLVVMAMFVLFLLFIDSSALHYHGRIFLTFVVFASNSVLMWISYEYSQQYTTWFSLITGVLLGLGTIGVFILLFIEAHEMAEAIWIPIRRRSFNPVIDSNSYRPKVSVHVPCYNEPPEMVKQTLDALANLDYPDFEVLVIDNNTYDPTIWKPVRDYCKQLGPHFHFFHVAPLDGFKSGALNYLIPYTASDVEVIAVIDSDYCVDPDWLKHMVPHFADPKIAVVQSPQHYRDQDNNVFKKICYVEYKSFFHIGMVIRNDRDAIIQHGTMTMIRCSVLKELGWANWCICEDTELGLRVFKKGYSAVYDSNSFGQGLMPDTFNDFKKQRFRWVYGAIQIMKGHAVSLFFGRDTDLTPAQRYHFVAGWLPWIADGLNISFTAGALLWSAAMIILPQRVDSPQLLFSIPPLMFFFFKFAKSIFLYRYIVGVNFKYAFGATLAGLALLHTIAKAVLYGFITGHIPFFRTPKMYSSHGIVVALTEAREEIIIMLLLWGSAVGIGIVYGFPSMDMKLWVIMLLVHSLPYSAALIMVLLSTMTPEKQ